MPTSPKMKVLMEGCKIMEKDEGGFIHDQLNCCALAGVTVSKKLFKRKKRVGFWYGK